RRDARRIRISAANKQLDNDTLADAWLQLIIDAVAVYIGIHAGQAPGIHIGAKLFTQGVVEFIVNTHGYEGLDNLRVSGRSLATALAQGGEVDPAYGKSQ